MSAQSITIRNQFTAGIAAALNLVFHKERLVQGITTFGRHVAVPNATFEPIAPAGLLLFLEAPDTMRIKAGGDAADDATGAGARSVKITGLAVVGNDIRRASETIVTSGVSASAATTLLWWRIDLVEVDSVGTYGVANTAEIIIENVNTPLDRITIPIEVGSSEVAVFSTPDDHEFHIEQVIVSVDAVQAAEIRMLFRTEFDVVVAPMKPLVTKRTFEASVGETTFSLKSPLVCPPLTDIFFEGSAGAATASVTVSMDGKLIPV